MTVQESIDSAFEKVPYPGDDCIALHECPECREIREDFRGKPSQLLADDILERRCQSLPLLSPSAFRYFVPAYMHYSLAHPDSEVAFFTFQGLGIAGFDAFDLERFRLFSRQQKEAVITFLEFFKSHEIEGDDQDNREYQDNLDAVIKAWKQMPNPALEPKPTAT
ncbi:MAG TPA: DUF6714 family protein [Candidatus Aquilonibacter sp.]|nr:DUF6714 family protein [Candidatus Aquilonibacter sp.]